MELEINQTLEEVKRQNELRRLESCQEQVSWPSLPITLFLNWLYYLIPLLSLHCETSNIHGIINVISPPILC